MALVPSGAGAEKPSPGELLAAHLASIGSPESREAARTRVIRGEVRAVFRMAGVGEAAGRARLASQEQRLLLGMDFSPSPYREEVSFDGDRTEVALLAPGRRSPLGQFLYQSDAVLKHGLLLGALSTAWPLETYGPKALRYAGLKKVDGHSLHQARFSPPKGTGDLEIVLFFDAETTRHVRTEYRRVIPPPVRPGINAPEELEQKYLLTEEFSDFAVESGLSLPHTYRLQLTQQTRRGTLLYDWTLSLRQFELGASRAPLDLRTVLP